MECSKVLCTRKKGCKQRFPDLLEYVEWKFKTCGGEFMNKLL